MIAILNNAKGRVGVNAQAVIMVFLGLIVGKRQRSTVLTLIYW